MFKVKFKAKSGGLNQAGWNKAGIFVALMLLLPLVQFAIFWVYVNINSIAYAFKTSELGEFTLENFERVFTLLKTPKSDIRKAVVNTLKFFPINNFVVLPLSVLFAFFLFKRMPMGGFFRVVFFLPSIVAMVVFANLFVSIINPGGPMDYLVTELFHVEKYPQFLFDAELAMPTVFYYVVWTGLGYNILLVTGAMFRIPDSIFESAKIEGCGFFREFISLVVPLIGPTVSTLFITGTAGVLTAMGPILVLTPNGGPSRSTGTIAWYIYDQVNGMSEYYFPAALGLVFTVIAMPVVLLTKLALEKIFPAVEF